MRTPRFVAVAAVTVSLALALSGCRYYWYKPGTTQEAFARDNDACLQDASAASPMTQKYGVVNEQVYRACLASRGYQRQNTTEGPDRYRGREAD